MNDRTHDIPSARRHNSSWFAAWAGLITAACLVTWPTRADETTAVRRLPPVAGPATPGLLPASTASGVELSASVPPPQVERADFLQATSDAGEASHFQRVSHEAPAFDYEADANPFQFTAQESVADAAEPQKKEEVAGDAVPKRPGEPQTFGQRPTNYSLQFLRTQDVLLDPGSWQFDTGFAYTNFDHAFPVGIDGGSGTLSGVVQGRVRTRLIYSPLAFRYGWSNNVQAFGVMPVGYSGTQVSTVGTSTTDNSGGIGDFTGGLNLHLLEGGDQLPDVIGTVAFTAPTGNFNAPVFGVVPGTALGQGFWALSGQLLFINRYDPIIAFYGVGFRHLFERDFNGVVVQPGEQLNYQFGVGFSANDRVTLSATFQGFFISNMLLDGSALLGTNVEPMSLRFAATIARNCRIVEPFALIGMTDSAPNASFGVTVTFY
jgi:hypothetical protein